MACDEMAHKTFGKTTTPGAAQLVMELLHGGHNDPFQWVIDLAVHNGSQLGLYAPATVKRRGLRGDKPVYSLEHLAASDDQVVAFTTRWREFEVNDPKLLERLLAEAAYAISSRGSGG